MKLTLQQLETHLWGAANILLGKTAGKDQRLFYLKAANEGGWTTR